jgi:hypothetical protein
MRAGQKEGVMGGICLLRYYYTQRPSLCALSAAQTAGASRPVVLFMSRSNRNKNE